MVRWSSTWVGPWASVQMHLVPPSSTPAKGRAFGSPPGGGAALTNALPRGRPARRLAEQVNSKPYYLPSRPVRPPRSEEHTSELQSLMRISYAVFCLKKKKKKITTTCTQTTTHTQ